jgi:L,D-peptidoglycan transpeptidase YkuD (ErfK/YbiS/YcfS/YnhG family)
MSPGETDTWTIPTPKRDFHEVMNQAATLTRMQRTVTLLVAVALLSVAQPSAHAASVPDARVGDAQQVIVVEAPRWSATEGTLTTYERVDGKWKVVQPTVRAQLGYGGMVRGDRRRQGTGTTPTGVYDILSGFGRKADPGTGLDYIAVDRDDVWPYNPRVPSTYNVFQNAPRKWKSYGSYVEYLWDMGMQYNYVAVLDYNLPKGPIRTDKRGIRRSTTPPNTSRGGGIFLHVDNGRKTAGCIAVKEPVMRDIMRWLDPKKKPVFVIQVR